MVTGETVRPGGTGEDARRDDVRVDGRRIRLPETHRYILLNKPKGCVTTRRDPQGRRTVLDLLDDVRDYVYPVGRLDYESEGLLLLTNDGDLAAHMMHPRHGVQRTYDVLVEGVLGDDASRRLARGVVIDGRRTAPAIVEVQRRGRPHAHARTRFQITITEGRNRQVRRMCEAVGHQVVELRRIRIGPISDARLRPGAYRDLRPEEVRALRRAAHAGGTRPPAEPAPG